MALFIEIEVDSPDLETVRKLVECCPVDIFHAAGDALEIVDANLDECTLCELCLAAAPPGRLRVRKLYSSAPPLERSP